MNRSKHVLLALALLVAVFASFASCKEGADTYVHVSKVKTTKYKIAVVLPIDDSGEYRTRLEHTVNWALENMRTAEKLVAETGDTSLVDLDVEWYDEDTAPLEELSQKLARRSDILLVVGPLRNENVTIMARACAKTKKPLIVPSAASEDIIRRYAVTKSGDRAEEPFLWSLCETDVSQSSVAVAKAWEGGAKTIALLTPDSDYGKTFYDWVPFLANDMNLTLSPDLILQYDSDNLAEQAQQALSSEADCIICAAASVEEAKVILQLKSKATKATPRILFTNGVLSQALLDLGEIAEGTEGVAPYADPTTGFQIAYEERFGYSPAGAEAQVYDAILLSGLTAFAKNYSGNTADTNDLIREITSVGEDEYPIWNELGLRSLILLLKKDKRVKLVGASGVLRFDSESLTTLVQSTYVHWMVYENKFVTIDYCSTQGNGRTASTLASWKWNALIQQQLNNEDVNIAYKPLKDQWAVLVQGSNEWKNYRHQADVLNVYQMLKRNGWDDDHIILILSDDIANNVYNIFPGEVRTSLDSPDLYKDAVIDYNTDTLNVSDISKILLGQKSAHLPKVIETDDQSNVLFFWSGHGCLKSAKYRANSFVWRNGTQLLTDEDLRAVLQTMRNEERYRKMLLLLEPCFSRNLAQQASDLPGILAIASASGNENSFADFHSNELGVWMSDRYTNNLVATLTENPNQTFKDLYEYLYRHTLGSHVYVENNNWFGNLFKMSPDEFIIPVNKKNSLRKAN